MEGIEISEVDNLQIIGGKRVLVDNARENFHYLEKNKILT